MTIAAILKDKGAEVTTLPAEATVAEAVALFARARIGAAPVVAADGTVAGMFSERDVIRCLADGPAALDGRVADVMTTAVATVTPEDAVVGALALMTRRRFRHLPVLRNGRLAGLVSIGDLVKYRIDRIEAEAEALRVYIQSA